MLLHIICHWCRSSIKPLKRSGSNVHDASQGLQIEAVRAARMGHADHGTHQKENTKERIQHSTKACIDETKKTGKHDFGKGRNQDSTQRDHTSLWYTEKGHLWTNTLMWYNGQVKRGDLTFLA